MAQRDGGMLRGRKRKPCRRDNTDEPRRHCATCNKPDRGDTLVSSLSETFLKIKENQTHRDREQDGGCWKLGAGKETGRWWLNVDTFRCTRSKLWGSNAQHGDDKTDR